MQTAHKEEIFQCFKSNRFKIRFWWIGNLESGIPIEFVICTVEVLMAVCQGGECLGFALYGSGMMLQ